HEVKNAVQNLQIKHRASNVCGYVTLSFGVASLIPGGEASARAIVESADQALYRSKALGRNQIAAAGMGEGVQCKL
ncbi:MAG: diguanylate cyclase, partial [Desulfobacterales bacterium]|nr:diguanylate cyclase [Desulfobacterales bacterium]